MAVARNNLSRRAVLGAALAVPAVLSRAADAGLAGPGSRAAWEEAHAGLRDAEATLERFLAEEMRLADDAFNVVVRDWPAHLCPRCDRERAEAMKAAITVYQPFEDRLNDLECAHLATIRRLLVIPAPDLSALAIKITLAVDYDVSTLEGGEECMAALKADAARLATPA